VEAPCGGVKLIVAVDDRIGLAEPIVGAANILLAILMFHRLDT
jgi:hypothetical protein